MGKLLLLPIVWVACAWSWASYFGSRPADKEAYWANAWGWLSPQMADPWSRVAEDFSYHNLKNVGAEYCRAWPQTAAKSWAFLSVVALIATNSLTAFLMWVM